MTTTDDILKAQEKYSNPWAQKPDFTRLRDEFVKKLTDDPECGDLFHPDGTPIFENLWLDDIMEIFDKAVKELEEE